jgi:hypothetical protein
MARRLYTVAEIALAVRARIDEMNRDSIDTTRDIVPALNRALEYATDIYARYYPDPYIGKVEIPLVEGETEYDLPEDVYEDRLVKVDVRYSDTAAYQDVQRVSYQDIAMYESNHINSVPFYYSLTGRTLKLVPAGMSTYTLRLWYVKNPEQLVLPQGRITLVNTSGSNNYLLVDGIGDDLTTETDQLASYVNVINSRTGEVRGTLQIASIDGNKIRFRTVPSRYPDMTVLGRTISGSLADVGAERDDYICLITGTCVPYLASPTSNFIIQYAIAELSRQLGTNSAEEEQVLAKFEDQVKRTWAGREPTARVAKRSGAFGVPFRRWILTQKGS